MLLVELRRFRVQFFGTFSVLGSCFGMLAVIPVSRFSTKIELKLMWKNSLFLSRPAGINPSAAMMSLENN